MILIFQILYALLILVFSLLGVFITYHIFKYSYDKKAAVLMAAVFLSFFGLLLFSNIILFAKLPLEEIFSYIL